MIRLASPDIDEDDIAAVSAVLRSGNLVQGEQVRRFEERVARFVGTEHAVAVSSCTAALHLSLTALGVGPGDSVAVPTYSWPATANAIALCGARPVFVDIEPTTFNLDPARLEVIAGETPQLRVLLPVHAFGCMADVRTVTKVADRLGAVVLEDAACALGARLDGQSAGAWGTAGCFSFHPRKSVTTGEGGVVTTNDASLARTLRALRNHGIQPGSQPPEFGMPGFNLRLTEFQAALGSSQLTKLPRLLDRRRAIAARYAELLEPLEVSPPFAATPEAHVYQSYVVLLPEKIAATRGRLIEGMRARGVEVTIGTHHMPLTAYWRATSGFRLGDFPATDSVSARALSLPIHTRLQDRDLETVVEALSAELNLASLAGQSESTRGD
jgi:perosamine synthetase